jgi:hypothetical protein
MRRGAWRACTRRTTRNQVKWLRLNFPREREAGRVKALGHACRSSWAHGLGPGVVLGWLGR